MLNQTTSAAYEWPQFDKVFICFDALEYQCIIQAIDGHLASLRKIAESEIFTIPEDHYKLVIDYYEVLRARMLHIVSAQGVEEAKQIILKNIENGQYNPIK